MSFFGVTLEIIEKIWDHPNAERLELAKLVDCGFQFVIGKNSFKQGDRVVYFPVDSVLPKELLVKTGFEGKLSGQGRNRVKTVKLRGEISQGLVASCKLLDNYYGENSTEELTKYFGVTKYEPPVVISTDGNLLPLPDGVSKYDIEGADRNPSIVNILMDEQVYETEKLEGTNCSISFINEKLFVNQRCFTIEEKIGKENLYWQCCREQGLLDLVKTMSKDFANNIQIYGELCGPGVQSNIYKLNKHSIYVFDIKIGNLWMEPEMFLDTCDLYKIKTVPKLSIGRTLKQILNSKTIQNYSNGESILSDRGISSVKREGIVFKPLKEQYLINFGRLFIKQRSPEYLANCEN